ncbi:MAG: FAD-dependent oxidoreductase [Myxococcota bacterium]
MFISKLLERLPSHLAERSRLVSNPSLQKGAFVLYWMRTAARGHDNPALDTAIELGNALGLPIFVYHGLSERYPYASDRHHRFILEGAIDVSKAMQMRQIGYAFHLERPGHRGPVLKQLASMASIVVIEDMPTDPMRQWTHALAQGVPTPIVRVDTACIVPMALSRRSYSRAFAYRDATAAWREKRIGQDWLESVTEFPNFLPPLPFEPITLELSQLEHYIAECQIDHSVAPVPETKGGAEAGYKRWQRFKASGLRKYHFSRNDPNRHGVSRLSAYFHYGHISPFRIARECQQIGGKGAEKYLDELLIWRELAYLWCDHHTHLDDWKRIPEWARQSLQKAAQKHTGPQYSYEALFRGATNDDLWNACQKSLLVHGELHNNLRMTWGKQLIQWAPTPQQAHRWAIDLNHRYALDGRDPSSYGGLLWCFGQFDRAFKPPKPMFGTVRERTTESHSKRIDLDKYIEHINRPRRENAPKIAVIGAGLAGLSCARILHDHGIEVQVFDKGRGPGGRMSTRISRSDTNWRLDHGTPSFHCQDKRFLLRVKSWEQHGVIQSWNAPIGWLSKNGHFNPDETEKTHYVGFPKMSALPEHLARDLNIKTGIKITKIERQSGQWKLRDESNDKFGPFDEVVICIPSVQCRALLPDRFGLPWLDTNTNLLGCFTYLIRLDEKINVPWGMVKCQHPIISKIIREDSKPGRPSESLWTVHAMEEWTQARIDTPPIDLQSEVLDAFFGLLGQHAEVITIQAHRWRYAQSTSSTPQDVYRDTAEGLSICGDWLRGSKLSVEDAYLSGSAAAGRILGQY